MVNIQNTVYHYSWKKCIYFLNKFEKKLLFELTLILLVFGTFLKMYDNLLSVKLRTSINKKKIFSYYE